MRWVDIEKEKLFPEPDTKVIVKTKTVYTKGNVLECSFHVDKHGKPIWGCNNQIVTHFLKED